MIINQCNGYELEKEKSNTSEDFFNRSEITFEEDGVEKTLHVLYVRYFEDLLSEFTPFESNPIFTAGERAVELKDIVALVCLLKNPGFRHRKRVYINTQMEFASYFQDIDFSKLPAIFEALVSQKSYHLRSPLEYIVQPK
ncbi:hypothetical protein RRV45_14315 [Bacillus sp. DTU_2020_1000418_1_SI_GHA_SEK_038]|uniref:hypothetical protein n=1 Tax=Bacillus sp. DTU_2020_1000418_1_SI_GHA_SEK_038 TaxID=3077585 RepID=UPI0028E1B650|nr:hypothetical protein [Bacillus sp. DTU_2020_1000418_1_SI_GHA_SEK_038]WNS74090.1 hypothetical protein RRV45_14315 [Bacillus sp. DTU_2020_1000418_1_SI_GHA_SEK_038]